MADPDLHDKRERATRSGPQVEKKGDAVSLVFDLGLVGNQLTDNHTNLSNSVKSPREIIRVPR